MDMQIDGMEIASFEVEVEEGDIGRAAGWLTSVAHSEGLMPLQE